MALSLGLKIGVDSVGRGPYDALRKYILTRFGVPLETGPEIDLESVLTHLDIELALESKPDLLSAKTQLVRLLRQVFWKLQSTAALPPQSDYARLCDQIQPNDTVLTFNWDTLLDDCVGRRSCLEKFSTAKQNQYWHFVHQFTAIGDGTISRASPAMPFRVWGRDRAFYLKLHGSLDWACCSKPGCRNAGRIFPIAKSETPPRCGHCFERTEWMIVAPTLNKRLFEIGAIRRMWNTAANELAHADRVVVWGYSLPPTDFFSSWLLRNARADELKTVVFIDPAVIAGKKTPKLNAIYLKRFSCLWERAPADARPKVDLYASFKDFADGRSAMSNPGLAASAGTQLARVISSS